MLLGHSLRLTKMRFCSADRLARREDIDGFLEDLLRIAEEIMVEQAS